MNASSLYVTVLRLVLQNDFQNVFRLFPYLRQSLSCTVCGNLLTEPYSPQNSPCQHHECKRCIGGRKILKPSCSWCRDYRGESVQNVQLRLLLQCYKSLCEYIKQTPIYEGMQCQVQINNSSGTINHNSTSGGAGNHSDAVTNRLADIIDEGIRFSDDFKSTAGLSKATYSMLPCLYQAIPVAPPPVPTPPPHPTIVSTTPSLPPPVVLSSGPTHHQQQGHQLPMALKSNQLPATTLVVNQRPNSIKQISISSATPTVTTISGGGGNLLQPGGSVLVTKASSSSSSSQHHSSGSSSASSVVPPMPIIKTVSNGSALYSVMYAGSGNKITIKRKTDSQSTSSSTSSSSSTSLLNPQLLPNQILSTEIKSESGVGGGDLTTSLGGGIQKVFNSTGSTTSYNSAAMQDFKKPIITIKSKVMAKRKGCRCGNATLTPGKLTCCGQRCPCYVESKSCIDCKCRGCRNPHRPNGFKVRPHIPELENLDFHLNAVEQQQNQQQQQQPIMKVVLGTLGSGQQTNTGRMELENEYKFSNVGNGDDGSVSGRLESNGGLLGQHGSTELGDLGTEINLQSYPTGNHVTTAANGPGKFQVLSVYTAPSNMSQVTSTLPTIIMSGGASNSGNNFGSSSGVSTTTIQLQSNQSYQTSSFGQANNVSSFNLAGNLVPSTSVTFQSLFGEDLLTGGSGSSSVVSETIAALDDDDLEGTAGGVIIGSYGTDEDDDELSPDALHLNGANLLDDEESNGVAEVDDVMSSDVLDV